MKIFNKIHSKFVKLTYVRIIAMGYLMVIRSEEHTSELQSQR